MKPIIGIDYESDLFSIYYLESKTSEQYNLSLMNKEELSDLQDKLSSYNIVGYNLQEPLLEINLKYFHLTKVYLDLFLLARILQIENEGLRSIYTVNFPEDTSFSLIENDLFKTRGSNIRAKCCAELYTKYKEKIEENKTIIELEMSFLSVELKTLIRGIRFNEPTFDQTVKEVNDEYKTSLNEFCKKTNRETFKPNASKDLNQLLVEEMKLDIPLRTNTGKLSFSSDSLNQMRVNYNLQGKDDIVSLIDSILNLKSQFSQNNLLKKIKGFKCDDSTFRPSIAQIGYQTASSRVYMSAPALTSYPMVFRKSIIPHEGYKFLYADWSSAELYILSYLSKCERVLNWFKEGKDPHSEVSKLLLGKESITKKDRELSKVISFSLIYGSTGDAISKKLNISNEESSRLLDKYFQLFPEFNNYRNYIINFARKNYYTKTILGRRRYLNNINSQDPKLSAMDERRAMNYAIQSSCADLFKMTAIKIDKEKNINWVLGVFDSYLLEVPEDFTNEQAEDLLNRIFNFSDVFSGFKFGFKYSFGKSWYESCQI